MIKSVTLAVLLALAPFTKQEAILVEGAHCLLNRPVLMAQDGNPGHREPPPGWACAHGTGNDKDAPCKCHRECKDVDELDEMGEPTGRKTTQVKEDPKCSSFCYKDHCACGADNCD